MNIIINQNKLLAGIRAIERVVAKNISLPILNTILLRAEKNTIILQATNLEIGIKYTLGAKVDITGAIAIPARIFSEFIGNLHDDKVSLVMEKNILSINSDQYQTKILCIPPDEFPIIPIIHNPIEIPIPAPILHEALMSVVDATSLLETRPELNGVYIRVTKDNITLAATDSFRLSERIIKITAKIEKEFIIPRDTTLEILRLIGEISGDVILAVSENQLALKTTDFELVSRLINGRYPDYQKVIPERIMSSMEVNKDEFDRYIRTASIFSSSVSDINLHAVKGGLSIKAKNSDKGDIAIQATGTLQGDAFDLNLNYRYLLDGLKIIPTESVIIGFTGVGSPVVLRAPNRQDLVYVIMPLRS